MNQLLPSSKSALTASNSACRIGDRMTQTVASVRLVADLLTLMKRRQ
jgi:hypothetical protein